MLQDLSCGSAPLEVICLSQCALCSIWPGFFGSSRAGLSLGRYYGNAGPCEAPEPWPEATPCQDFDVKLDRYPKGFLYMYKDEAWWPVCGQGFWNTNRGAHLACHKMGYETGELVYNWNGPIGGHGPPALKEDGIAVGLCGHADDLDASCQCPELRSENWM